MNILVAYRGIPQSPGRADGDSMVRALRRLGHNAQPYAKVYQNNEWLPREEIAPDLLIRMECCDNDPQYEELFDLDCPRVYWEFDTATHREWSEWWSSRGWDKVFMANPKEIRGKLAGATYLPYGVDDQIFYPRAEQDQRGGIACIGHRFDERVKFCEEAGVSLISGIYGDAYAEAMGMLEVSVHHYDSGGDGLLVGRIWESLASGCILLTPDGPTLQRHFEDRKHLITYTDADDCRNIIDRLKEWPDLGFLVAKQGMKEVQSKHTFVARARAILAEVGL